MKDEQRKNPFKKNEDDFDFEILDALEGHAAKKPASIQDDEIDLSLDNDLDLDEEEFAKANGFSFDDQLSSGLEEELLKDAGLSLEDSFENEEELTTDISIDEEEDFSLDLRQDAAGEISFDEEEISFDAGMENEPFETESGKEAGFEANEGELGGGFGASEFDAVAETRAYTVEAEEREKFGIGFPEEPEASEENEERGAAGDLRSAELESAELEAEMPEMNEEMDIRSSGFEETETKEPPLAEEPEFQGKSVITVGKDAVINLGDEKELAQKIAAPTPPAAPIIPPTAPPQERAEERAPEEPAAAEEFTEESAAVFLDLHDEERHAPLTVSMNEDDTDMEDEMGDINIDLTDEEPAAEPAASVAELPPAAETAFSRAAAEAQEEAIPETDMPEDMNLSGGEMSEQAELGETTATPIHEELDEREYLGLTLRLRDDQMQSFEGLMREARTLQNYIESLEAHKTDVKETIYQKLLAEYNARKRAIFKTEAFTDLFGDVEGDLRDMAHQRQEFVTTIARLNEELEEITVRHLVGEFDDQTLAEKERAQKTEIALWNDKTEKIETIITRYQTALDAECALNPLRNEAPEPETPELPEPEAPVQEEDAMMPEESAALETLESELPDMPEQEPEEETLEGLMGLEEETMSESEEDALLSDLTKEAEAEAGEDESLPEELLNGLGDMEDETFEKEFGAEAEAEEGELEGGLLGLGGMSEFDAGEETETEEGEFEGGEFLVDDLSGLAGLDEEGESEEDGFDYDVEPEDEKEVVAATIACKKCGRQTPADEKFCVHCGGKAK